MSTAVAAAEVSPQPSFPPEEEIRRVFELQRETALRWRMSTAEERIARVERLRDALLANLPALYEAAYADMHKPPAEVDFSEVMPTVASAHEIRRNLRKWMKPKPVRPTRLMVGTKAWIREQLVHLIPVPPPPAPEASEDLALESPLTRSFAERLAV